MWKNKKDGWVVFLCALFLMGFSLTGIFMPDGHISVSERRKLASFPKVEAASILSGKFMKDFEAYTLDQFPMRDSFRTLKAVSSFYILGQKDNHGIYMADGHGAALEYPLNASSLDYAAQRFSYIYKKYLEGSEASVYFSLIPDKHKFLAEANGYPLMDYERFAGLLEERLDFAQYIDIMPLLSLEDYYRTDAHWRQEKIEDVAWHLLKAMGAGETAPDTFICREASTDFYGVYYGQLALPMAAETMNYMSSPLLEACRVFDHETGQTIPMYDLSKTSGNDPYELFLGGPKSLITVENPQGDPKRELIVFRDSFGSSIAPLLVQGYGKITLVDIRYLSPAILENFITFEDQDVLFLYSTSVLNNSETLK